MWYLNLLFYWCTLWKSNYKTPIHRLLHIYVYIILCLIIWLIFKPITTEKSSAVSIHTRETKAKSLSFSVEFLFEPALWSDKLVGVEPLSLILISKENPSLSSHSLLNWEFIPGGSRARVRWLRQVGCLWIPLCMFLWRWFDRKLRKINTCFFPSLHPVVIKIALLLRNLD